MIVGFIDSNGERIPFDRIAEGSWDYPLPMIRWLARQHRDTGKHYGFGDALGFSVTEIVNPTQIAMLKRRHEVYVQPDEGIKSALGTLMHAAVEIGVGDEDDTYTMEQRIVKDIDGVKLGGTIDLLELVANEGEAFVRGYDYKLTSRYSVKGMLEKGVREAHPDYFWQGNIYAWMAGGAYDWHLVAVTRDHDARTRHRPIEVIEVPLLPAAEVEAYVHERVQDLVSNMNTLDVDLPACTDEETWQGRRCASYCEIAAFCHQNRPELDLR